MEETTPETHGSWSLAFWIYLLDDAGGRFE